MKGIGYAYTTLDAFGDRVYRIPKSNFQLRYGAGDLPKSEPTSTLTSIAKR